MANPRRRPGRPPLPPDEGKRHALGFRATAELRDALVRASGASGRPLAQEIEFRLVQSLADELQRSEAELEIDRLLGAVRPLVRAMLGKPGLAAVLRDPRTYNKVLSVIIKATGGAWRLQPEEPAPETEPETTSKPKSKRR
jgi:hypothetical protein